ncbi:TPR-like protein [Auriscalpium vulgare]|uniref:TPR-like protein n=1 Tax=Auriscalpium vulgare TaxID=40419 RepID=A0ACB8S6W8_9AGAM|nr:TPR-like protein [Auriscalpium vulgare]
MAHPKDKYYWAQLRTALTGGLWGSPAPAKAYNTSPISWSELLRKFNKHNHGYRDIAEIANQTQALALLIAGGSTDAELDGDARDANAPLALADECMLAQEHEEEANTGYEALKHLEAESPKSDSLKLALAYYAYSLGRFEDCLSYLGHVRDLANAQSMLNPTDSVRSAASTLQVPSVSGETSSAGSFIGSFASLDSSSSIAEIADGKAWAATEVIRSVCLQGMSYEKLTPSQHSKILGVYLSAVTSLPTIESEISRTSPPNSTQVSGTGPGRLVLASFTRYRELWRWVERLLWRAITVAARSCALGSAEDPIMWALFSHYQKCSAHWPPTFRPDHRSTISTLHLRALVERSRLAGTPPLPGSSSQTVSKDTFGSAPWLSTARKAIREHRDILNASTVFPKAGERNVKVEELVDLCVAVWDASRSSEEHAGWVLDILWWATRLTFNCPRVFRHMTRVAAASGDTVLATRALRLYVQTVGKAQEAGEPTDSDTTWVATLVWGARMLCRVSLSADPSKGERGIEEAREAGVFLEKARARLDSSDTMAKASLELAEGIWSTTMAIQEQDHLTRTSRLSDALSSFQRSVETLPSASAYYHLALALYRPIPIRDLDGAIANARLAVESEPNEIRYWHVLGLLLVASEDWRGAREVLEVGAALDDQQWAGLVQQDFSPSAANGDLPDSSTLSAHAAGEVIAIDFATAHDSEPSESASIPTTVRPKDPPLLLDEDVTALPEAASLFLPLPDHPPPTQTEKFEHALQLRMTQLALTELMEGPEGAGEQWIEVFGWFADRKGTEREQIYAERNSMEASQRSQDLKLDAASLHGYQNHHAESTHDHHDDQYPPTPVPITLTPATPALRSDDSVAQNGLVGSGGVTSPRGSLDDGTKEKEKAGKKVQKMLKSRVHKGQQRITTIGKKLGQGVGRHNGSLNLRRITSTPADFYSVMTQHYQASSIHSRRHSPYTSSHDLSRAESPHPLPPPSIPPRERGARSKRERRLLSELWLMSAATFRRSGKIEQARGAIQEAEVRDEENPSVWVQLGLYYMALGHNHRAIQAFNKALFIAPDSIPATIHLSQVYLSLTTPGAPSAVDAHKDADNVDLAAGLLSDLTRGCGWDCAEAWYFLGKANGMRGLRDRERECLTFALGLSEGRALRDVGTAVGWCI